MHLGHIEERHIGDVNGIFSMCSEKDDYCLEVVNELHRIGYAHNMIKFTLCVCVCEWKCELDCIAMCVDIDEVDTVCIMLVICRACWVCTVCL